MTLAEFTSAGMIVPQLSGGDPASVIQELCQALQREKRVTDLLPFYQAALNREFLVSTDMEAGMAFPHARLPGLKSLAFALGRSGLPLNWGAKAGQPVRLVFLLAVPATESTRYLLLISGLARLARQSGQVAKLLAAPDATRMFEVLQEVQLRSTPPSEPGRREEAHLSHPPALVVPSDY
jgi:mannitol/fructose-specific phosphotransferase system IIA component (Ntr-type)